MNREPQLKREPLFPFRFTLLLAVVLAGPLLVRTAFPSLEPYPAALLPAGSSKLDLSGDEIQFEQLVIMGLDEKDQWVEVEVAKFLDPIPPHYLYVILENEFGLSEAPRRQLQSRLFALSVSRRQFTPEQERETKQWLSARLIEAGLQGETLRIVTHEDRLILESHRVSQGAVKDEFILTLQ